MSTIRERASKWYQDRKLMIAFVIIVMSFILGIYSKAIIIIKFYEPVYLITGLSLYTFSWLLLFIGVFMVGWSTVKAMNRRINSNVKSAAKKTYYKARNVQGKATELTKKIHKKSLDKIKSTSKSVFRKINQND